MTTATKKPAAKKAAGANTAADTSTAVAVRKSSAGAVVSIKDALRAQAEKLAERTAPASGIAIQVSQSKEFKLPDGTKARELDLVVVDFISANLFYEGTYDPNNITPPACFAIGDNPRELVPSDNSPVRQNDTCKGCPMNEFGSAGNGKACKNTRVLAVLPPDADEDTPMWLLKVSPTALKAWDGFVMSVQRTFQMPPIAVVTKVSFDENLDYPSLRFSVAEPNEALEVHYARQEEARQLLVQEPDVSTYEAPKPAPRAKPAAKTARR